MVIILRLKLKFKRFYLQSNHPNACNLSQYVQYEGTKIIDVVPHKNDQQ